MGHDERIPANKTISDDFYIYNEVHENMHHWGKQNHCTGKKSHYPTEYDGILDLWCEKAHETCNSGVEVVWCAFAGGHVWPDDNTNPMVGTKLVWSFFKKHKKT